MLPTVVKVFGKTFPPVGPGGEQGALPGTKPLRGIGASRWPVAGAGAFG